MQEVEFRAQACRLRRYHQRVCRFLQKFTSILFPPLNDFILKRGQDGIAASPLPALTGSLGSAMSALEQAKQCFGSLDESCGAGSGFCSSPLSFWHMPAEVLSLPLLFLDRGMGTLCSLQEVFESG